MSASVTGTIVEVRPHRRRWPASLTIGVVLLAFVAAVALVSLVWLPYELSDTSGSRLESPSAQHWLGTDKLGRDTFSYVMVGTRIALTVGLSSAVIAMVVGLVLGTAAAFLGGWLDDVASSLLDVVIAFPTLLLAMLIGATQGASLTSAVWSIGLAASAVVAGSPASSPSACCSSSSSPRPAHRARAGSGSSGCTCCRTDRKSVV